MNVTIQSKAQSLEAINNSGASRISKLIDRQILEFEYSRFGMMALYMVVQSCLGSVACMYILQNGADVAMLSACVMVTMVSNAIFISQLSAKWCLGIFSLSLVLNTLFIVWNF